MKNTSPWWIRVPLLFFLILGLMEYFVDSGEKPAIIEYPAAQLFMLTVLFILIAVELVLRSVENVMFHTLSPEAQERYLLKKNRAWEWKWGKELLAKMANKQKAEEEKEIILDHNYDGIRELDNNLPTWWTYLFYATIVFAVVYLARFHIFNDYDQDTEYAREVAEAQIAIDLYKKTAKDLIDVNTVELLTETSDLNAGKTIYANNCVACHMADGGGGIGPNLADEYWILGGGIKNVFNTVSEGGRAGKGMVAWKQMLKPVEMAQVSSYIISELGGTVPANPKDPEGDVWTE